MWLEKKIIEWGSMQALIDLASSATFGTPGEELRSPPPLPPITASSTENETMYPPQMAPEEAQGFGLHKEAMAPEQSVVQPQTSESMQSGLEDGPDPNKMTQRMLMERLIAAGGLAGAEKANQRRDQSDHVLEEAGGNGIHVDHGSG